MKNSYIYKNMYNKLINNYTSVYNVYEDTAQKSQRESESKFS